MLIIKGMFAMRYYSLSNYKRETVTYDVARRRIIERNPLALSHDKSKGMVKNILYELSCDCCHNRLLLQLFQRVINLLLQLLALLF